MLQSTTIAAFFAAALLVMPVAAGNAQAATHELTLTGRVASATTYTSEFGGIRSDSWVLNLDGLSMVNSFTIGAGDSVRATITLDQPVSVPNSDPYSFFGFSLSGTTFPATVLAAISGTNVLSLQGVEVRSGGLGSSAYGRLYNGMALQAPFNQAYVFDAVLSEFTVSSIGEVVTLDSASIAYTVQSLVPEPATWFLLVTGFVVLVMRTRWLPSQRELIAVDT